MKQILDHGYLSFVEAWGSDERVVEAARMSTGKGFLGWGTPEKPGDEKLLSYLNSHRHTTPFEMAGMVVEVKAPIFVFREWHRHRTFSFNEMSARYAPLPDEDYAPTVERCLQGGGHLTRQAGTVAGSETLTDGAASACLALIAETYTKAQATYEYCLNSGMPKELARVVLPVGRYSRMRASANLHNWLRFLSLRMALDAQLEIRLYANAAGELIAERFPRTWALFAAGRS